MAAADGAGEAAAGSGIANGPGSAARVGEPRTPMNTAEATIVRRLAALDSGLPDCAGVALGVDRLVMAALELGEIDEAMAFPLDRA